MPNNESVMRYVNIIHNGDINIRNAAMLDHL